TPLANVRTVCLVWWGRRFRLPGLRCGAMMTICAGFRAAVDRPVPMAALAFRLSRARLAFPYLRRVLLETHPDPTVHLDGISRRRQSGDAVAPVSGRRMA